MMERFLLRSYVQMVDYTRRLFRHGKTSISAELAGIVECLGCSLENWNRRMQKLNGSGLVGCYFAATRAKLQEISKRVGVCLCAVSLTIGPARS